jgi:hypothetical protein
MCWSCDATTIGALDDLGERPRLTRCTAGVSVSLQDGGASPAMPSPETVLLACSPHLIRAMLIRRFETRPPGTPVGAPDSEHDLHHLPAHSLGKTSTDKSSTLLSSTSLGAIQTTSQLLNLVVCGVCGINCSGRRNRRSEQLYRPQILMHVRGCAFRDAQPRQHVRLGLPLLPYSIATHFLRMCIAMMSVRPSHSVVNSIGFRQDG